MSVIDFLRRLFCPRTRKTKSYLGLAGQNLRDCCQNLQKARESVEGDRQDIEQFIANVELASLKLKDAVEQLTTYNKSRRNR